MRNSDAAKVREVEAVVVRNVDDVRDVRTVGDERELHLGVWPTLVLALASWLAWRGVLDLSLYAWDSYPLIAAGRVRDFGEFVGTFREELMDGRFPGGHYYRPLVHLSFALDHAMWGLNAFGYHLTDLVLLALGGLATAMLALALIGSPRRGLALLAGLAFVAHPVHFEIVPLPPRRADELALVLTLFALTFAARKRGSASVVASLCALGAAASKETGVLAPPLIAALAFAMSDARSLAARVRAALHASWFAFALVIAFVVVRSAVLGGLGGGARTSLHAAGANLATVVQRYATLVVSPLPPSFIAGAGLALAIGAALVVALLVSLVRARPSVGNGLALRPRAAAGFLVFWAATLVALTAFSGTYRAWYALPFVAPLAVLAALALATGRDARSIGRPLLYAAFGLLLVLQGLGGDTSRRWDEIRANSSASAALLQRFDRQLAEAQPGATLEIDAYPDDASATRHGAALKKSMLFSDYSLAAYVALAHPDAKVRVEVKREANDAPAAAEILVLLVPRALPDAEANE